MHLKMLSTICFNLDQYKILLSGNGLTLPKQALVFTCLLLKTLWEKEKLLVTSNFSFFHSVFNLFGELSAIFIKLGIVLCKLLHFGIVENLSFGKGLKVGFVWSRVNNYSRENGARIIGI